MSDFNPDVRKNTHLTVIFCHCNNLVDVTTGSYTEETLRALNKNHIIDVFLKTREQANTTIASITSEIKCLNKNFQMLESNVSVTKNVNNILSKQMSSIEKQC